jgi:hypothetical protein
VVQADLEGQGETPGNAHRWFGLVAQTRLCLYMYRPFLRRRGRIGLGIDRAAAVAERSATDPAYFVKVNCPQKFAIKHSNFANTPDLTFLGWTASTSSPGTPSTTIILWFHKLKRIDDAVLYPFVLDLGKRLVKAQPERRRQDVGRRRFGLGCKSDFRASRSFSFFRCRLLDALAGSILLDAGRGWRELGNGRRVSAEVIESECRHFPANRENNREFEK